MITINIQSFSTILSLLSEILSSKFLACTLDLQFMTKMRVFGRPEANHESGEMWSMKLYIPIKGTTNRRTPSLFYQVLRRFDLYPSVVVTEMLSKL